MRVWTITRFCCFQILNEFLTFDACPTGFNYVKIDYFSLLANGKILRKTTIFSIILTSKSGKHYLLSLKRE